MQCVWIQYGTLQMKLEIARLWAVLAKSRVNYLAIAWHVSFLKYLHVNKEFDTSEGTAGEMKSS